MTTGFCFSQDWKLSTGLPSGNYIQDVTSATNSVYVVGMSANDNNKSCILRSSDNGETWSLLCEVDGISAGKILVNNGRIILSGYANDGYVICYSDDLGESWAQSQGVESQYVSSSMCVCSDSLLASCGLPEDFHLYTSVDNGKNWNTSFSFPSECNVITALSSYGNFLLASYLSDNGPVFICSSDSGKTWSLADVGVAFDLCSGVCADKTAFYVVGMNMLENHAMILKSADGGKSFKKLEDMPEGIRIHNISALDNGLFVIATDSAGNLLGMYRNIY